MSKKTIKLNENEQLEIISVTTDSSIKSNVSICDSVGNELFNIKYANDGSYYDIFHKGSLLICNDRDREKF